MINELIEFWNWQGPQQKALAITVLICIILVIASGIGIMLTEKGENHD
ncbi:ATP synthase subunit A [Yersinia phage vB_YenM_636]|nr:F0F1 ATP synthase subunit A [Yersinia phage vB_Yen_X1]QKN86280.1 ATP synthase subunit A [Yersinia phage vB_YenM_12]QKN86371.1 ATP synthase subunit A [Yersinia phage vB_YenM_22]QKN86462.1 ATP synthase subunit A [Yersinia phage vB_YenM_25]QKN86553.1 ATP synthase subunit A [Yersinia phage vB_YenM_27]QKN86644.1 ATP synthase subunit A [Yersinia phage vB_YenM_39]QKN86735.1 ATP synthase subunit A [Yersinia phage vB_YenM_126]QKN86826.1 ATP synthase subunit A [Yersinia phage vB_YenM_526-1]QKN8691